MINSIRKLHGNNLGWLAEYDQNDPEIRKAAEKQKALVTVLIDEFKYPVGKRKSIDVSFTAPEHRLSPFMKNG